MIQRCNIVKKKLNFEEDHCKIQVNLEVNMESPEDQRQTAKKGILKELFTCKATDESEISGKS